MNPALSKGWPLNSERGAWKTPPDPGAALPRTMLPFPKPSSAPQEALTSGQRLFLSPKFQPYFLLMEGTREAAIHRVGDPFGLRRSRLSLTTQGDSD